MPNRHRQHHLSDRERVSGLQQRERERDVEKPALEMEGDVMLKQIQGDRKRRGAKLSNRQRGEKKPDGENDVAGIEKSNMQHFYLLHPSNSYLSLFPLRAAPRFLFSPLDS
ncbi:unnamed protein product [Pleuronectes platessa]|uniref:Uncharacterized protein n=1 Tax=Pleuronectes platessa TaxID=8262 RepID=A0A9N7V0D3_PLEPL|nr:unnamed protein product [Pleuronectes platessa]